jgi:hypothetical protein
MTIALESCMRKTLDSLRVFIAASYMTVQPKEHQDGTDQSLKYADNTRAFDGQAAHTQGGTQDVDGSNGAVVQADASTTVGVRDVRLKSAATATVMPTVTSAASTNNSETRVAFVPAGQNSAQGEVRLVTQDMIESAGRRTAEAAPVVFKAVAVRSFAHGRCVKKWNRTAGHKTSQMFQRCALP